jgi:predicted hydrocarbon binding protein
MSSATLTASRQELGDFSSIVCFKALVVGVENALGEKAASIALLSAGRDRGKDLVKSLGLSEMSVAEATPLMQKALGKDGTRLCVINSIEEIGDVIKVSISETICSSGEPQGSDRKLSYTQGAIHGALEALTGYRLRAQQTESVLRGGQFDVLEFQRFG